MDVNGDNLFLFRPVVSFVSVAVAFVFLREIEAPVDPSHPEESVDDDGLVGLEIGDLGVILGDLEGR